MEYFTTQIKGILRKYIPDEHEVRRTPSLGYKYKNCEKIILFPRDINLMIVNYLNKERDALGLLKILKINDEYYTSKLYYTITTANKVNYRVNKYIVKNIDDLDKINNLKIKEISLKLHSEISTDNLQENTVGLIFEESYSRKINIDKLPKNLVKLELDCNFNQTVDNLPKKITHLTFELKFNQPVDNLPNTIKYLTFGRDFDQCVDDLPKKITRLIFGCFFNQPVNSLPNSITHLTFGKYFNQPVYNLPQSVTHLKFGDGFNQPVNKLPENITHLKFGDYFNQPVNNLPNSITHLEFGDGFDQPVDNLPKNLTHLTFGCLFDQLINNLPKNIIELTLGDLFSQITNLKKYKKLERLMILKRERKNLFKINNCCRIIIDPTLSECEW